MEWGQPQQQQNYQPYQQQQQQYEPVPQQQWGYQPQQQPDLMYNTGAVAQQAVPVRYGAVGCGEKLAR